MQTGWGTLNVIMIWRMCYLYRSIVGIEVSSANSDHVIAREGGEDGALC